MESPRKQRTLGGTASVAGFGYWSGRDVGVEFQPAEVDTGIVFVRRDLPGCPRHRRVHCQPRRPAAAHQPSPRDSLGRDGRAHRRRGWWDCKSTTAKFGSTRPKCPAATARRSPSSKHSTGRASSSKRPYGRNVLIRQAIRLGKVDSWIEARPPLDGNVLFSYHLDYGPDNPIGRQVFETALTPDIFRRELAPCRTFLLKAEADWLLSQGIARRVQARDPLGVRRQRPDRQPGTISRRMRPAQTRRHAWRLGAGRMRLERAIFRPSQRPSSQRANWSARSSPRRRSRLHENGVLRAGARD